MDAHCYVLSVFKAVVCGLKPEVASVVGRTITLVLVFNAVMVVVCAVDRVSVGSTSFRVGVRENIERLTAASLSHWEGV